MIYTFLYDPTKLIVLFYCRWLNLIPSLFLGKMQIKISILSDITNFLFPKIFS